MATPARETQAERDARLNAIADEVGLPAAHRAVANPAVALWPRNAKAAEVMRFTWNGLPIVATPNVREVTVLSAADMAEIVRVTTPIRTQAVAAQRPEA